MKRALSTLFLLAWSLWFGGVMFLFFAVSALFANSHSLGASAAPVVFLCFEKYHLTLACVAVGLGAMLLETPPKKARRWIFVLVILGCITAVVSSQVLTPRINQLHMQGLTGTPEFLRLHGISFGVYLIESAALLIVGLLLPTANAKQAASERGPDHGDN